MKNNNNNNKNYDNIHRSNAYTRTIRSFRTSKQSIINCWARINRYTTNTSLILTVALIVSLITYSGWTLVGDEDLGIELFFKGNALFILLISYSNYLQDRNSFIRCFIYELAIANMIKELFLDVSKLTLGESLLLVAIPIIWCIKNKKYN
jgi:hypothetical protein